MVNGPTFLMRRMDSGFAATLLAAACLAHADGPSIPPAPAQSQGDGAVAFVHPGVLHTADSLARMRERVAKGEEPWRSGFEKLKEHAASRAGWKRLGPFERVSRNPGPDYHAFNFDQDGNAAYQNALLWCITGDSAHARAAMDILNAWSAKLRAVTGRDQQLTAALGGFKYANAAELIRHTCPEWPAADAERCERMLREVIYPPIRNFAPFANGNWDTACIKTMMAIGVYCDDRELFDRAVGYYRSGKGNGRLAHYIVNAEGQCQESGRDQQHAQLGLGHLAEACEIAWNQGVDLYGEADNRLLRGFEYTARYNLGEGVPFAMHVDTTGKYMARAISARGRGLLRPIYEMVWNHYENRRGVSAAYTRKAAERIRPEGAAFQADHPGFGTILFSLEIPRTEFPKAVD
jgi:hypothetical protein